jgi:hypothetical protein
MGLLAAAAVLAVVGRGDVFVLALLLAIAVSGGASGAAAVLSLAALVTRVGSSSLAAATGAQVVLGPFAFVGPVAAALSVWCAAAALVLAAPAGLAAVPFGLAAALVLAGPAAGSWAGLLVRLVAAVAMVDLALTVADRVGRDRAAVVAAGLGAAAFVLAWVGRPPGRWRWDAVVSGRSLLATVTVALLIVVIVAVAAAAIGARAARRQPA